LQGASSPRVIARRLAIPASACAVALGAASVVAPPALGVQHHESKVVAAVPQTGTPNVNDGVVYAVARAGGKVILGGNFSSASPAGDAGTVYVQPNTMAFDADTGAIDTTGYQPTVDGRVNTIIPGPKPDQVYIGGSFTTVDGKSMRVALLDTQTGALVSTWHPAALDGQVYRLVLSGGRLYAAGTFSKAGGRTHAGLVALRPSSGKVTSYVSLDFTGHHNYQRKCDPSTETCARGEIGVRAMDVTPNGKQLVAIGNFVDVSGTKRDQIAMLRLGKQAARLDAAWNTKSYTAKCFANADDSYVRDVQFSPDGEYFVVAATGGVGTNSDGSKGQCDAAARYESADTGKNVKATWVAYTGEDTLWTATVTDSAVYVGGHQRWLNNSKGLNEAAPGAVPRPGLAALSPISGLPLAWNPGRNPRGGGAFAILATGKGLYVGSDTDYIGNGQYLRKKIAFFPLAGGETLAANATPKLPGRVYLVGALGAGVDPDRLAFREASRSAFGSEVDVPSGISWSAVHGAFTVNGQVIYGLDDGFLYQRSFDGNSFGAPTKLDPYDDPEWDSVQTGSGQTYRGVPSDFTAQLPAVTSMFFRGGRLYFSIAGDSDLHWRWFEPDSGIVGADDHTVAGGDWASVAGAFLAGKRVYFADGTTGRLRRMAWRHGHPAGTAKVVDRSADWASHGLFALSSATNPTTTPEASFTDDCKRSRCSFVAARWSDPDGGTPTYRWSFGDGKVHKASTRRRVAHRYDVNGRFKVKLRVWTTSGAAASVSHVVHIRHRKN